MTTINPNFVPTSFYGANNELTVDKKLAETVQADVKATLDQIPDAGADNRFLAAIADLSPAQVDTPAERKELFAKFAAAAQKVESDTSMPFTGDIAKFLARAMIEHAGQQRQQAVDDRMNARQAAQAEMLNQASQQEKAAKEMMTGAIVNAVVSGIGAGLSFAGSAASFGGQMKSIKDMNSAMKQGTAAQKTMLKESEGLTDAAKSAAAATPSAASIASDKANKMFEIANKKGQAAATGGQIYESLGGMMKTAGGAADSGMQAQAKKSEAEGSRDAAQAEYLKQVADGHKEIQDQMKTMMDQIINFIKELQDAEVDAMRAITRG